MTEPSGDSRLPFSKVASQNRPDRPENGRRRGVRLALAEIHHRLRRSEDSPAKTGAAVGVGVLVGCLPVYGLHFFLCVASARAFRLSLPKAYLAAHINNPFTGPFLLVGSWAVGHAVLYGRWPALRWAELREMGGVGVGGALVVGSLVVGVVLGAFFGAVAYLVRRRWGRSSGFLRLAERAAEPYLVSGIFDWEFARGKYRYDPLYYHLLTSGVFPPNGRLLDLGCGRGLFLALWNEAREWVVRGEWPAEWGTPPSELQLVGIERREEHAAVARTVTGERAEITTADLASYEPPVGNAAVLLLDVLHYLGRDDQHRLVERVASSLKVDGVVVLREAMADGGLRFLWTRVAERLCAWGRGHWRQRFHYRPLREWRGLLADCGLETSSMPMADGTPYANALVVARRTQSSS